MLQPIPSRAWPLLRTALVDERDLNRIPSKGPVVLLINRMASASELSDLAGWIAERRTDLYLAGLPADHPQSKAPIGPPVLEHPEAAVSCLLGGGAVVLMPQRRDYYTWPVPAWAPQRGRWKKKWLRMLRSSGVPVIPLHLRHPGQRNGYPLRVGQPIASAQLAALEDDKQLDRHLAARIGSLGSVSSSLDSSLNRRGPWLRVIHTPFDRQLLREEIAALPPESALLAKGNLTVFEAGATQIPHLLHEIGRQREIAFQDAGEGSARLIDLDEYDGHYRHLFAWDREKGQLAGAYRLGPGDCILRDFGKSGFYLHSLFHIKDAMAPVLASGLELGRSFVVPEYQQQRLPLFLLWKGVSVYLQRHPQYQWLLGPVSISNRYSQLSRSIMVRYIQTHYFNDELAALVRPRKPFVPDFGGLDADALLAGSSADPRSVDALIADIEPAHFRLPVLLRQYFAQNARIIGFNVDPAFSDALDGFMVCRTADLSDTYR
jgi:hypothetical protein